MGIFPCSTTFSLEYVMTNWTHNLMQIFIKMAVCGTVVLCLLDLPMPFFDKALYGVK
jgi:hypothetical protein